MERRDPGAPLKPAGRISTRHFVAALRKVRAMDVAQQIALVDEIKITQPNLLASCLVQAQLGADQNTVGFLLNILLVCYQSMHASGLHWPPITTDEQERQMARMVGSVNFTEDLRDSTAADVARSQYVAAHPEQPLLAFVLGECGA